jgi:hypothetical protein
LGGVEVGGHLIVKLKLQNNYKKHFEEKKFVLLKWGDLGDHLVVSLGRGWTWWPLDFHPKEIIKSYNNIIIK